MDIKVNIPAGIIFDLTKKAYDDGKKVIIHKGGTGSGKTYDIMISLLFFFALTKPNWVITIVSESVPHLDIGTKRIAKNLLSTDDLNEVATFNQTKGVYQFDNGTIIEFFSADRIGKALGARRNLLYGNEIDHIKFDVWEELSRRSEIVIGDFNPTSEFWLEQWLAYQDDYTVITSNYLDNDFLSETERNKIKRRADVDDNFRRIHIDCEYGNYEGLIFTAIEQVEEVPEGGRSAFGLDFGYTNDPSALIKATIIGNDLYLDEHIYQTQLSNAELSSRMKSKGVQYDYDRIYADCAEPKSIDDLHLMGWDIHPAVKGADSIVWGLDVMKQYSIKVTKRSVNLLKELRNYSYAKDKNGKTLNKPIDSWNHAIDAARYAVSMMQRSQLEYNTTPVITNNRRL